MLKVTQREGSPYLQITGTFRGQRIRQSTGTADEETAQKIRIQIERDIIYGTIDNPDGKTVADAIEAYIDNGGEERYLEKINEVMGKFPLASVNQEVIDKCAREAYAGYKRTPEGKTYQHKKSTIKRQFYDPVAAVLHYAAQIDWVAYRRIKKPKITLPPPQWAEPEWFAKLWKSCDKHLKATTMFLAFTGSRINECLAMDWKFIDLKRKTAFIYLKKTKGYRTVHLPDALVASLKAIRESKKEGQVFPYKDYHAFHWRLKLACKAAKIPFKSSHKIGSHTFATWLRRYTGMDGRGLVDTGRWKSQQMAERYTHTDVSAESKKVDAFGKLFK